MADTFNDIVSDADDVIIDALGETVTITGKGTVVGVFEEQYLDASEIQGVVPTFTYRIAHLLSIAEGAQLVRGSTVYTVRYQQPDGTGMNMLILRKD